MCRYTCIELLDAVLLARSPSVRQLELSKKASLQAFSSRY